MIQRPQSIFLLIVIGALLALVFISAERLQAADAPEASLVSTFSPYLLTSLLSLIGAGVAMYALFKYNHRGLQLRLGVSNTLLMTVMMVLTDFFATQNTALLLFAVAFVSNLLANRYIRKDEKLVKSSERMR